MMKMNEIKAKMFDLCLNDSYEMTYKNDNKLFGIVKENISIFVEADKEEADMLYVTVLDEDFKQDVVIDIQEMFPNMSITLKFMVETVIPEGTKLEREKELTEEDIEVIREQVAKQGTIDFTDSEEKYDKLVDEGKIEAEVYDLPTVIQRMYDYLEDIINGDINAKDYPVKLERIISMTDPSISEEENPAKKLFDKYLSEDKYLTSKEIKEALEEIKKEYEESIEYAEPEYYTEEELASIQLEEDNYDDSADRLHEFLTENQSDGILDLKTNMKGEAKDIAGLLKERRQEISKLSEMILDKFENQSGIKAPQYFYDKLANAAEEMSDSELEEFNKAMITALNVLANGSDEDKENIMEEIEKEAAEYYASKNITKVEENEEEDYFPTQEELEEMDRELEAALADANIDKPVVKEKIKSDIDLLDDLDSIDFNDLEDDNYFDDFDLLEDDDAFEF